MSKTLIVYYSWSGNTRKIAELIQKNTGGDIFEIKVLKPYPQEYSRCTAQAKQEINSGYKPELIGTPPELESYDTVFVGTPNWWSTVAPPVTSFLIDNDWQDKTVVPFCTHGSGGVARCFSDMKKHLKGSAFADGLVITGSAAATAEEEVKDWLNRV